MLYLKQGGFFFDEYVCKMEVLTEKKAQPKS